MADPLYLFDGNDCAQVDPATIDPGTGTQPVKTGGGTPPIVISASVGLGGKNTPDDSRKIQQGLNEVPAAKGGASPHLAVDGLPWGKTVAAIRKFQTEHFGAGKADGRVDPNGYTLAKMNELRAANGSSAVRLYEATPPKRAEPDAPEVMMVLGMVQQTRQCLMAANMTMLLVEQSFTIGTDGLFGASRREAQTLANTHFNLSADANPLQLTAHIKWTYQGALSVLQRYHDDPLTAATMGVFVPDKHGYAGKSYAASPTDGPNRRGERWGQNLYYDRIYVSQLVLTMPPEFGVMVAVHELMHFCGGREGSSSFNADRAKGWHDAPKMGMLTPWLKTRNAYSLANFAFDNYYHRKPSWIR